MEPATHVTAKERVQRWHVPLSRGDLSLCAAQAELSAMGLKQQDVPFMIQLVENPKYDLPLIDMFHGATDLATHDRIHILLGRGLLAKDEAFTIGFTMGSTDRVSQTEETLFGLFAKYLYPREYRFTDEDLRVFRDAVRLGFVSDCVALHSADIEVLLDVPLSEARARLGIEVELLRAYFAIEKRRYPASLESQRLLD